MINSKYKPILATDSRYYIVTGGRGSGKSFAVNTILAVLTREYGHTILFTRYTLRSASISIIPEFIEKIEILGYQDLFHVTKDESIFDTIDLSVRQKGIQNRVIMIMNPTTKEHFIY